jgi:hypothetical protein
LNDQHELVKEYFKLREQFAAEFRTELPDGACADRNKHAQQATILLAYGDQPGSWLGKNLGFPINQMHFFENFWRPVFG